jgi:molecular chaperone DnaK
MKEKMEALTNAFYPISTRIYQEAQAQAAGGEAGEAGTGNQDGPSGDAVDADFEVVED